jgi:hypothetical protein
MGWFEWFGILLAAYAVVRVAIWWDFHELSKLPPAGPRRRSDEPGTPIDTSKLAGRVEEVRQHDYAGEGKTGDEFKKQLLVEEKRREMEKMAYFQKPPPTPPPPSEPTEPEGGFSLMSI